MKLIIPNVRVKINSRSAGLTRLIYAKALFKIRKRIIELRKERDQSYKESDDILLQTVGVLTIGWATMERKLDDVVAIVFNSDIRKTVQQTLPVTTDSKLNYLRKARGQIDWLDPFKERMTNVQTRIKAVRQHRKNITHGIVSVSMENFNIWETKVLQFEGNRSRERSIDYDPREITGAIGEIYLIELSLDELIIDLRAAINTA